MEGRIATPGPCGVHGGADYFFASAEVDPCSVVLARWALDVREEAFGQSLTRWPDCPQNMQSFSSKRCLRSCIVSLPLSPSFDERSILMGLASDFLLSFGALLPEVGLEGREGA